MYINITFVVILGLLLGAGAFAQIRYPIDVADVKLGAKMSKEQVIAKFGVPDDYHVSDDGSLVGFVETYFYGKNSLSFMNGEFNGFDIYDARWNVMSDCFENGLRVGMPLSVIAKNTRYRLLQHNRIKNTYWILDNPVPENTPDSYNEPY